MKKIETLVEDIYDLFNLTPIERDEKEVDELIDKFGDMLKVHIKEFMYSKPREGHLRLSGIGKPNRQLWYDVNTKTTEESLPPSTRIKFLYGYILEELLLLCAEVAGHTVEAQQKEVSVEGVLGHQDAIIDGVLVDCKSASGRSFDKFASHNIAEDDPFGYIAQISAYAQANGIDKAAFLAIDKSTGKICLTPVHSMEMINAGERVKKIKKIVAGDIIPDRCYDAVPDGKSGNYKLPIGCVYCRHKELCWSDANQGQGVRTFKYANGKRYLVQIAKMPEVEELTY
jgi:hypothetical protein|tara:strand:- start:529 stop:1383 length:855 start_codon:yes stop_codon:yes gene_type:complete